MKYIILLALVITAIGAKSQDSTYTPPVNPIPKKCNTIVLHVDSTNQENLYKEVAQHLIDKGAYIENSNKEFFTLSTKYMPFKNGTYLVNVAIKPSQVIFSGYLNCNDFIMFGSIQTNEAAIEYIGMKGSPMKNAFEAMQKLTISFPHNKVEYLVR